MQHILTQVMLDIVEKQIKEAEQRTHIRKYTNPKIRVSGILLTMYNGRTRIAKEVTEILEQLAQRLDTKVFTTKIRSSVKATEIQFKQGGLFKYAPRATVTEDYRDWITELLSMK